MMGASVYDRLASAQLELATVQRERDELRAVVEKLPKTADGVAVVPGMVVYAIHPMTDSYVAMMVYMDADNDEWQNGNRNDFSECYSTKAAALAAKGGGK
jgi:hypothetical protein